MVISYQMFECFSPKTFPPVIACPGDVAGDALSCIIRLNHFAVSFILEDSLFKMCCIDEVCLHVCIVVAAVRVYLCNIWNELFERSLLRFQLSGIGQFEWFKRQLILGGRREETCCDVAMYIVGDTVNKLSPFCRNLFPSFDIFCHSLLHYPTGSITNNMLLWSQHLVFHS